MVVVVVEGKNREGEVVVVAEVVVGMGADW